MVTTMKDAKCFFWTIKLENNTAFLIGSMHLMRNDMHPLPDKFENAFSVSPNIVFEADLEGTDTNEIKQYVQSVGFYPPEETIWKNISQKTQKKLLETLSEIQFPVKVAEKIKPWLLSTMLEDKSEDDDEVDEDVSKLQHALGLDDYFFQKSETGRQKIDVFGKCKRSSRLYG